MHYIKDFLKKKNLFPDVDKDQNTQSVKVLDLNLKLDEVSCLLPSIKNNQICGI